MQQNQNEHIAQVAAGYDAVGAEYFNFYRAEIPEILTSYVNQLASRLQPGNTVIELGCGNGLPVAASLARQFEVTGIDVSEKQLERARTNVPNAEFTSSDMAALEYDAGTFHGVVALYSIIHLPRDLHSKLFQSIYSWLKPGGLFLATFASTESENWVEEDWFGAPMYWSGFPPDRTKEMIEESGFAIDSANIEEIYGPESEEEGEPERHLWVVARKPN
jgi:cyclopropane fatty-acyl-phospholipid synthase-like methyltransferase